MASNAHSMTNDKSDEEIADAALMAFIANGDREAFNTLLSRHLFAVVQFSKRYLSNQDDAEDVTQEAFFRVWQKAATWKAQGYSPRSWIYRIAYNLCIDEIRRRTGKAKITDADVNMNVALQPESLEQTVEKNTELSRLTDSLNLLPERQRTALSLCALQGLSNKEAAAVMEVSVEALESLLSRGRRQLRNLMQRDGEPKHE
jgi:RNA polymerase sigma-70 factor (ECF subfamily)